MMRRWTLSSPELGDALSRELVSAWMHAHENLNPRADCPVRAGNLVHPQSITLIDFARVGARTERIVRLVWWMAELSAWNRQWISLMRVARFTTEGSHKFMPTARAPPSKFYYLHCLFFLRVEDLSRIENARLLINRRNFQTLTRPTIHLEF